MGAAAIAAVPGLSATAGLWLLSGFAVTAGESNAGGWPGREGNEGTGVLSSMLARLGFVGGGTGAGAVRATGDGGMEGED